MIRLLFIGLLITLSACSENQSESPVQEPDPDYATLYQGGVPFDEFLENADRRRQRWLDNYAKGGVPDEIGGRVAGLSDSWNLLVVAVAGCSDSVNIIPYLAHMVDSSEKLDMRIIDSESGAGIMSLFLTPDNRGATPTVVVLDSEFNTRGVFVERPAELQEWALTEGKELENDAFVQAKFDWYDADMGLKSMTAVLDIIAGDQDE